MAKPVPRPSWLSFYHPLSNLVWAAVFVSTTVFCITLLMLWPMARTTLPLTLFLAMAATTSPLCFRCQTWGHDKAACAAPGPSKLAAPQLSPRPVLLREKALADIPPLPRYQEVQESPCGAPPERRHRRSGRKKATTFGTQTAPPETCCVGTQAAPRGCSVGTQAAVPRSGGVATQTPSPPTPERAPPPPPAAESESSSPSCSQATQNDGETPKDLNLDEAFLIQPKKKRSPTDPTTQMLDIARSQNRKGHLSFGKVAMETVGCLLGQGFLIRLSSSSSNYILLACWLMFGLLLSTVYRGSLIASLTLPRPPTRPETVEELVTAVER
ncbi:hypothetical protein Pmani_002774 [Petrolisthes manimaculis]|uniref:Uncharacterized protein n=1 Tax=Petrolisthes manimaculis TaxID=1843537 RepID=A0AAE1QKC2_9EUCA|nr:hypothetical protein Pmani_031163 [Petrolisthes manimaculis]KAK4326746.1 hypothetical protein Pmani_002763 [Petrolisthes manimaculis]KAK4326757.1 hypothetical protein Pmani_002774 [Petrolisthes manimaculis]